MLTETLIASVPMLTLILLMLVFKVKSHWSALITMLLAAVIACFFLPLTGAPTPNIPSLNYLLVGSSLAEGITKAIFPILGVIVMALFSYNILLASGEIETIKSHLSTICSHRSLLVLLITWGFGGLLEGIAGFGTAVAIPAAILVGLGFNPIFSASVSLIANTVFTDFGAVGITLYTLVAEFTGSTPSIAILTDFSQLVIFQFIPLFFIIPFVILTFTDKRFLLRNIWITIIIALTGIAVQLVCVALFGYQTPSIVASIVSMAVIVIISRHLEPAQTKNEKHFSTRSLLKAWSVYILIISLILLSGGMIPDVEKFLHTCLVTELHFPSTGATFRLAWLGNSTLWIFIGSVAGAFIQGLDWKKILTVFSNTLYSLRYSALTIISLICMANIMGHSGMTASLAKGIVALTGAAYPTFAPVVGAIGTFITGSNTSSQILFGKLQSNAAAALNLHNDTAIWLGASNITGGSAGKMISPQSIAIATAACKITGEDDRLMRKTLPYSLGYLLIICATIFAGCLLVH